MLVAGDTERGDLRAACTVGWHPTLPMSAT